MSTKVYQMSVAEVRRNLSWKDEIISARNNIAKNTSAKTSGIQNQSVPSANLYIRWDVILILRIGSYQLEVSNTPSILRKKIISEATQ